MYLSSKKAGSLLITLNIEQVTSKDLSKRECQILFVATGISRLIVYQYIDKLFCVNVSFILHHYTHYIIITTTGA